MNRPVTGMFEFITPGDFMQVVNGLRSLGFRPASVFPGQATHVLFSHNSVLYVNKRQNTYRADTADTEIFFTNAGEPCYGRHYITWYDE